MDNKHVLSTRFINLAYQSRFALILIACILLVGMACLGIPVEQQVLEINNQTFVAQTVSVEMAINATLTAGAQNNSAIISTSAAQTVAAELTRQAQGQPSTQEPTTNASPTITQPASPPTPTMTPSTSVPCDWAQFITDVTIPDGTTVEAGAAFTKTWRLKNIGTCTWSTSYTVIFSSGDAMDGPAAKNLTSSVAPGETIDISVNLVAPTTPNTYIGKWKLKNASGAIFGIGSSYAGAFTVKIVVPAVEFSVTHVDTFIEPESWSGPLGDPASFQLHAHITTNAGGPVKYHWRSNIGDVSAVESLNFGNATTLETPITYMSLPCIPGVTGYVAIYIDQPNHQEFSHTTYHIEDCHIGPPSIPTVWR